MKAKSIRSYAAIENDMHKARVLNEIGLIELEQNHLKEATHYLEEVREIHAKVVKGFELSLEEMAPEAANNVSKNQYYDQSVQSMQTALKICLRAFG
jgi:FAD synthase